MNTKPDNIDWDALEKSYGKPITPEGLRLDSKKVRLQQGKVRGESKAARRMRRRAVVG